MTYNTTKTIRLENWHCFVPVNPYLPPETLALCLRGEVYDHPHYPDGDRIRTSRVLSVEGKNITTQNTVYVLGEIDPEYKKWIDENYPNWDANNPIKEIQC
jgi:hypothetical protein